MYKQNFINEIRKSRSFYTLDSEFAKFKNPVLIELFFFKQLLEQVSIYMFIYMFIGLLEGCYRVIRGLLWGY